MLESIAIIVLSSLLLGSIFKKLRLPPLLAMLIIGIVFGPYVLDFIDSSLIGISYELRQLALIIILTRAGLSLNISELKRVGRPAVLMSFIPATCEICAYVLFCMLLLGTSVTDALLIGSVMSAISPAVVVPRMLKLKKLGYNKVSGVPSIITASSSVDDVFVIILFTAFLSMAGGGEFDISVLWYIPVSIILGIGVGVAIGKLGSLAVNRFNAGNTVCLLIMLCISILLLWLESSVSLPYSALLSIITMAVMLNSGSHDKAVKLENKYSKLWVLAEILLFALIGAEVDISFAANSGLIICAIILLCLCVRMCGVFLSLIGSRLTMKERLFCGFAYTPKATVQAAIGGTALALGLAIGQTALAFAVVGILLTAPLGALLIDCTYKKLLPPLDTMTYEGNDPSGDSECLQEVCAE